MPNLKDTENYVNRVLDSAMEEKIRKLSDVLGDHPVAVAAKKYYGNTDSPIPSDISFQDLREIINLTTYPDKAKQYLNEMIERRLAALKNPKTIITNGPEKRGVGNIKRKKISKIC